MYAGPQPRRTLLTEENLRMYSAQYAKARSQRNQHCPEQQPSNKPSQQYHAYDDYVESEDGELEGSRDVEMRREASLEALQAYGGCFVSGFLAMQQPFPGTAKPAKSASSNLSVSTTNTDDSPRPDSDTLSHMDLRELNERARICRNRRRRRDASTSGR